MQPIATNISMKGKTRGRPIKIKNVSISYEETKTNESNVIPENLLEFNMEENVELPKNNLNLCS